MATTPIENEPRHREFIVRAFEERDDVSNLFVSRLILEFLLAGGRQGFAPAEKLLCAMANLLCERVTLEVGHPNRL